MDEAPQSGGLLDSLRRLLGTVLEIGQVRLEIFGTELELEKRRLFDGLLWGAVALMVLGLGFALFLGFVILLVWEGYRLPAIGVMAVVFLTSGAYLLRTARQRLSDSNGLFNSTLSEIKRDRAALNPANDHDKT